MKKKRDEDKTTQKQFYGMLNHAAHSSVTENKPSIHINPLDVQ